MSTPRPYDIVLFGATGFTGGLTARYLARHAPHTLRWALAGRNPRRLAEVRDALAAIDPAWRDLPLLPADAADPGSLHRLAASTRTLVSTVGPYVQHGEPVVAACAEAGTDYLDITGEPEFVDLMYVRHHERATRTGARLVHACGFDCVPADLGVHLTVGELPADVPVTVDGYLRAWGVPSSGTYRTVLLVLARRRSAAAAARARRRAQPVVRSRRVRAGAGRPGRSAELRRWVLPLPSLDPVVVGRSATALDRYGPDFRFRHHLVLRLPLLVGAVVGVAGLAVLVRIPPVREWLLRRAAPGAGPTAEQRARGWFSFRFVGVGGGRRVVTEVVGGDPGYDETAKMLAESALCLTLDNLPPTAGQVTPAAAMGDALTARLRRAGITFRVLSLS
ncbi:saccharopine dehydrogenase family protein [Micromonospora sp. NBC_01796]|uniref:saccharopine dehydrogenase family protein n=1 Tax=Micromonospora sp. NBC_01796 TaxID=2975987 RepID=UPI002DD9208A|nr:saccharopine dehydrogenase NADP-binding domain-containing protein [Micromonospora sp. NBC_01796]WSA83129.1 saccharopine dehydrogenase NADP-binding domain-containing protein [Micromonospora sp. NBC_01796]